jgi:hypothetical protein
MLFRETVAVYCENHMEHTTTLCGQNAQFPNLVTCGTKLSTKHYMFAYV